jgi:hypothetical protein
LTEALEPEPRWLALVAVVVVGGLYLSLPPYLTVGPRLVMPLLILAILGAVYVTHRAGWHDVNHGLGVALAAVMTLGMVVSLGLLVAALPEHKESGLQLIRSAASLWLANILTFALWYWRLDAGGPNARDRREAHTEGAFLFPQMTIRQLADTDDLPRWSPQFVDYLFLAFNTSTAFSPTDTPVLTRWGKALMMVQSLISLTVLALLAARAVNIL